MFHTAYLCCCCFFYPLPCCIASFFLSFYLNSWYARGRKCVVIILWCLVQPVARYYKGTGRRPCETTLCCAMLCYACSVPWPLWRCRRNGKALLACREGGFCVFMQSPDWMYTTYPHTEKKSLKSVFKRRECEKLNLIVRSFFFFFFWS